MSMSRSHDEASPWMFRQLNEAAVTLQPHLQKLSAYSLVSVAALVLDFLVFQSLASSGVLPAMAAVAGYGVGMVLHYTISVRFVFANATRKSRRRTFFEFALSGLVGLAMTTAVVALATTWLALPPLAAKAIAVIVSFVTVFWLRSTIVFKPAAATAGT